MKVKSLTLSDPMDCSLPGSSVHRIFQVRVLEWVPLHWQADSLPLALHSSTLAWKVPWTEEPAVHGVAEGRTRLSDFTFTFHFHTWRRKWQPTPVFLPEESQGRGSLVGCRLWGLTELDVTEVT